MDLRQIQAFMAVIEHGSFTAAAKATHTVQSNISTHVSRLERELGAVLIDRSNGEPTQEGSAVILRARRIENELAALTSDVASLQSSPRGTIRFGMIGTTAQWLTPLVVERLSKAAPDVKLHISDGSSRSIESKLRNGDLDLGLLGLPLDSQDLKTNPLFHEDLIVVGPETHPLAQKRKATLEDLASHPLLLDAQGSAFRAEVEACFAELDRTPIVKLEVDGLRLLASLAFQGFGTAIVPATAATDQPGPWKRLPISGLSRRTVGLAASKKSHPSTATQITVECLAEVIEQHAPRVDGISLIK